MALKDLLRFWFFCFFVCVVKETDFSRDYFTLDWTPKGLPWRTFGIAGQDSLQTGCPSCHTTNNIKALKGLKYIC